LHLRPKRSNRHDLAAFPAPRGTDFIAPFFAPAKVASMKPSGEIELAAAPQVLRETFEQVSQTPVRCHCWKRRWYV